MKIRGQKCFASTSFHIRKLLPLFSSKVDIEGCFYGIVRLSVEFTKFKEAAMKKKFAVAMAITAGLCFAGSWQMKPAFAGYWEVLPNSEGDYAEPSDPNYSAWQSENALRAQGTSSYLYTSGNHVYSYYFDWKDDDSSLAQSGFYSGILAAYPDPGETGNAEGTGKRCIGFHWFPTK